MKLPITIRHGFDVIINNSKHIIVSKSGHVKKGKENLPLFKSKSTIALSQTTQTQIKASTELAPLLGISFEVLLLIYFGISNNIE